MSLCVSIGNHIRGGWITNRDATRVRVLDDGNRWFAEVVSCTNGSIRVNIVVVRHLLATILASLGNARDCALTGSAVKSGSLVRVFAITKNVAKLSLDFDG